MPEQGRPPGPARVDLPLQFREPGGGYDHAGAAGLQGPTGEDGGQVGQERRGARDQDGRPVELDTAVGSTAARPCTRSDGLSNSTSEK